MAVKKTVKRKRAPARPDKLEQFALVRRVKKLEADYDFLFGRLASTRQVSTGAIGCSDQGWLPTVTTPAPKNVFGHFFYMKAEPFVKVPEKEPWYRRLWRWIRA